MSTTMKPEFGSRNYVEAHFHRNFRFYEKLLNGPSTYLVNRQYICWRLSSLLGWHVFHQCPSGDLSSCAPSCRKLQI